MIYLFLGLMQKEQTSALLTEELVLQSVLLERAVVLTCFLPKNVPHPENMGLLLINDGQNMEELELAPMLESMLAAGEIEPLVCVGIHTGKERKAEYGTARSADYMGRGAKAGAYTKFIFEELLPLIKSTYAIGDFKEKSFAGFSLGGLSALDIVWQYPYEFTRVGVFSGSLWWRSKGVTDGYDESTDRIMHELIKEGHYAPWLRFFFETGTQDETMDRNNNGIIDSIDDTLALIDALAEKGYDRDNDVYYLELADGKHDVATWTRAFPVFLRWGWGTE